MYVYTAFPSVCFVFAMAFSVSQLIISVQFPFVFIISELIKYFQISVPNRNRQAWYHFPIYIV